jgi:hypothetical protein
MSRSADRRSTSNSNTRGSSAARRRRRQWLVEQFGDGVHVACYLQQSRHCLYVLDETNVSPDRLVLGADGGGYRQGNIQPACLPCQCDQGGAVGVARREAARAAGLTPMTTVG